MKIEVHLQGGLRKIIDITPGATVGATIGRNVFNADGTLYVPPSSGGQPPVSVTSWELILNIPPNVTALANTATTGLYVITAPGASATRSIQAEPGETTVSNGDGVAGNPAVGLADVADTGAGALRGITRDAKGRINGTTDATITGTAGQIDVANGDAAVGPPTISLANVADAGGGTLQRTAFDAKGRKTGTSAATTDDLAEGSSNLYFTAQRVRDTLLTGLSLASSAVISATDSVLSAFGKLQAQITALASSLSGYVPTSRTISTTAPLTGGGNLTANRTLAISAATTSAAGSMSAADKTKLNGIAAGATVGASWSVNLTGIPANITSWAGIAPSAKEDAISAGTTAQFWRGDKTFSNTLTGDIVLSGVGLALRTFANANSYLTLQDGIVGVTLSSNGGIRFMVASGASEAFRFQSGAAVYSFPGVPTTDNSIAWGSASNRWSQIFAANGTINTSDAREKTIIGPLTEQELAWSRDLASLAVMYQWNEAIAEKGSDARLHCSPTVQSVIASAEKHGLDPFRYGFVCCDKWDELPEIKSDDGEIVQEYRPAGDRYSLRPSELQFFIARGQEERIRRLEALLNP